MKHIQLNHIGHMFHDVLFAGGVHQHVCRIIYSKFLTDWGRVSHICVSKLIIVGSDNGFSLGRCQAIIWTNKGILLIEPLGTNFRQILIEIYIVSFICIWNCRQKFGGHFVSVGLDLLTSTAFPVTSVHRIATTGPLLVKLSCLRPTRHGPLARYVKLRFAHTPRTFPPPRCCSDPDMHHGTCVTHVPWCMSGLLTSGLL